MIGNEHEAYIEARVEFGRVYGGTRAEIEEQWERTKKDTVGFQCQMALNDGTVVAECSAGSESLRKRVAARLARAKWDDEDAKLMTELAELLGMDVDGMETI